MKSILRICILAALGAGTAWAGSPLRVPVHFAITNDAGLGYEWYVVGSHPDVGAWDPGRAIKLVWSTGNVWWGDVGVQAGTTLQYKFVKRSTAPGDVCDTGNGDWWPGGDNLQTNVPAEPAAPLAGKRIEFYSDLTNVSLAYSAQSASAAASPADPSTPSSSTTPSATSSRPTPRPTATKHGDSGSPSA